LRRTGIVRFRMNGDDIDLDADRRSRCSGSSRRLTNVARHALRRE
jgi:hypothetical protein